MISGIGAAHTAMTWTQEIIMSALSHQLLGAYRTPEFKYGDVLPCAIHGYVRAVGLTDGLIPWPVGKRIDGRKAGTPAIILYGGLISAVQTESNRAVSYWWGVSGQTVTRWRKALGVGRTNSGTSTLRTAYARGHVGEAMRKALLPVLSSPERRAKISAAIQGKRRPDLSARNRLKKGVRLSDDARQRMREAWHRHGFVGGKKGAKAWTSAEDELVRTLPTSEAAKRTNRTIASIGSRRRKLRLAASAIIGLNSTATNRRMLATL